MAIKGSIKNHTHDISSSFTRVGGWSTEDDQTTIYKLPDGTMIQNFSVIFHIEKTQPGYSYDLRHSSKYNGKNYWNLSRRTIPGKGYTHGVIYTLEYPEQFVQTPLIFTQIWNDGTWNTVDTAVTISEKNTTKNCVSFFLYDPGAEQEWRKIQFLCIGRWK